MRITVNHTELYFESRDRELASPATQLRPRPTIVALHGGPGFDQGYLRPGLAALADRRAGRVRRPARAGPLGTGARRRVHARADGRRRRRALRRARARAADGARPLRRRVRGAAPRAAPPDVPAGLILCHTAPTLARCPTRTRPTGLAERAGPRPPPSQRGCSPATSRPRSWRRSAPRVPHYAGPGHEDVPARADGAHAA